MRTRAEQALPFALLLPSVALLALLIIIPMVQALLLAVVADDGALTLEHFQRMTGDVNFSDAWRNTLLLMVLIVPVQIVLALVKGGKPGLQPQHRRRGWLPSSDLWGWCSDVTHTVRKDSV